MVIRRILSRNGKDCPICGYPLIKGQEVLSISISSTSFDNIHNGCKRKCGWVGKINLHKTSKSNRCIKHLLEVTRTPLELSIKLRKAGVSARKVDPAGCFSHLGIIEDAKSIGHILPQLFEAGATVKVNGRRIKSMKEWKDSTDAVGGTIWQ